MYVGAHAVQPQVFLLFGDGHPLFQNGNKEFNTVNHSLHSCNTHGIESVCF
jgi:hypothetical protein